MEMQYGSRANISHQPPGGRGFVDLRLFPLFPPSSSKFHQHQPPQSATGPCLGTHTPKHATKADQYKGWRIGGHPGKFEAFEPDNEPSSTKLESDSEDEASESDVQMEDIEEVQGEDMEAWEEDNQSFSF
jgi:hypothetical protein